MKGFSLLALKVIICIIGGGATLYLLTERQNSLIEIQMALPAQAKAVKELAEENRRLQFKLKHFENPIHLMEMSRRPEYGHLHYPSNEETLILYEPGSR